MNEPHHVRFVLCNRPSNPAVKISRLPIKNEFAGYTPFSNAQGHQKLPWSSPLAGNFSYGIDGSYVD
jgi:hypothetical protein